jgi:hypothetical protein
MRSSLSCPCFGASQRPEQGPRSWPPCLLDLVALGTRWSSAKMGREAAELHTTVEPVVVALAAYGAVVAMAVPGSVGQLSAGIDLAFSSGNWGGQVGSEAEAGRVDVSASLIYVSGGKGCWRCLLVKGPHVQCGFRLTCGLKLLLYIRGERGTIVPQGLRTVAGLLYQMVGTQYYLPPWLKLTFP